MRVLIVDDDQDFCEEAGELLSGHGFECAWVTTPAEIGAMRRDWVDLAVVDLQMPGTDGFGVLELLKSIGATPAIVLVSGEAADVLRTASDYAKSLGFEVLGSLTKPIDVDRLLALLPRAAAPSAAHGSEDDRELAPRFPAVPGGGDLQPRFQPQVRLDDGRIVGAEALARWLTPSGHEVSPGRFLPELERSGLMSAFNWWMTNAALAGCSLWRDGGLEVGVSINWNAEMLSEPEALTRLDRLREAAGVPAAAITIELVEGSVVSSEPRALAALGRLRLQGYRIALDDFGCAQNNFDQLVRFPINELKIDRSLVQGAMQWTAERSAVAAICRTATELGIACVAEGIETPDQARLMRDMGCTIGQGYLFAKPMPAAQLMRGAASLAATAAAAAAAAMHGEARPRAAV